VRAATPRGPVARGADGAVTLGLWLAEAAMFCMVSLIAADVICRNLFRFSLLISDEISGYLLVVMIFCGAGYSLRSGALLRIEFLLFALPRRVRAVVDVVYDLLAMSVTAVLLYELGRLTLSTWERKMVAATLLETPLWIPQLAMPVGCAMLLVAFALDVRDSVGRLLGRAGAAADGAEPGFEAHQ
jgi:TRAP-type C4-dicarboxylate transport system permease small subunit